MRKFICSAGMMEENDKNLCMCVCYIAYINVGKCSVSFYKNLEIYV